MSDQTTGILIKIYADQIVEDAARLDESPTFDWLEMKIEQYAGSDPRMNEDCYQKIRHLVGEKRKIITGQPPIVVTTNEERKNLVTKGRLEGCDYYWPRFKRSIEQKIGKDVAKSVDEAVNRVCLQLPDPLQDEGFICKGMVIGDVQAGKTNNYTALINKSADLGYRLIIVLTGVTEPLRSQTQARLDKDFVGRESVADRNKPSLKDVGVGRDPMTISGKTPYSLTDSKLDFLSRNNVPVETQGSPVLVVTKKNHHVLTSILRWLQSQKTEGSGLFEQPTLIVDDEADNASVNTADEGEDPKAINGLIRSIISTCDKVSYVAYTATPFANVFIDPDTQEGGMIDLFPSHFIVCLDPPSNYCGGRFFYSQGDEYFRESSFVRRSIYDCESFIPLKHKADLKPTAIPDSMKEALASFFVASAIKDIRRKNGLLAPDREKFDSCLINVSRFTAVQTDLAIPVSNFVDELWRDAVTSNEKGYAFQLMRRVYDIHYKNVVNVDEKWSEVAIALSQIDEPVIKTVHSKTKDELDYSSSTAPTKVVAIGGFKLSRGLTLDGLTVSYFYRRSMMYDTLMQMARWFGYRDGYRDLLRLYTTPDARDWYAHITEATDELKRDLLEMEGTGLEPKDFGIKVRSHEDSLIITAKNKMRTATEINDKVSYANKLKETFFVDRRTEQNRRDIKTVERFFADKKANIQRYEVNKNGEPKFYLIPSVSAAEGLNLLNSLNLDWGNDWARTNRLQKYLQAHANGSLRNWDIAFQSTSEDKERFAKLFDELLIRVQVRRPTILSNPRPVGSMMGDRIAHSLALGDNRKVASGTVDYVGIPEEVLELKPELRKKGTAARDWKRDNRPNPLLVFHLIHLDFFGSIQKLKDPGEQKKLTESDTRESADFYINQIEKFMESVTLDDHYLALSISIPGHSGVSDAVNYFISKREYEDRFGNHEYDE